MSAFLGDQRDGRIFENIAPSWIRYIFPPSLKYGMVVPVIGIDGQPFALICAHTHDRGKQFLEGYELQFLRAIGVIILSAVLRRRMILADRSKSVLISSVSHELRTPLHGILAATELLNDSPLDTNQTAFLSTVKTCGLQLIETVNHVLDFTKLSSEKSNGGRRVAQLTQVDLSDLVEQTVESCFVGQKSRFTQSGDDQLGSFYAPVPGANTRNPLASTESVVDIGLRPHGWNVMVDTGSLRRIVMNLYGNSLKFTKEGFVQVSLRELPHPPNATRIPIELTVVDTGKGIGKAFLKDQLFEPFTQENPLQPGTGLGLAIVNSIVRSDVVQGNVDVWSAEGVGTEIKVTLEVEVAGDPEDMVHVPEYQIGDGFKVAFLGFDREHRGLALVREVVSSYASFVGFTTVENPAQADLVVVNEFVKPETEKRYLNIPLILVATFKKSDPQVLSSMGRTSYTGLLYKPVGPAKVLKELKAAVKWLKHPSRANSGLSALVTSVAQLKLETDSENVTLRPQPLRGMSTDSVNSSLSNLDMARSEGASGVRDPRDLLHRRRSDERGFSQMLNRPALAPRGLTYHAVPTLSSLSNHPPGPVSPLADSETSSPASAASSLSTISLANGGAMLMAAALPELSGVRRRSARVLVVEDNVINRRVLTAFLKKRGYDHAEAVNGAAGVELFGSSPANHWE
jgi:signal transduction histidine kinase/AmiR/NasT family two-component response regulator